MRLKNPALPASIAFSFLLYFISNNTARAETHQVPSAPHPVAVAHPAPHPSNNFMNSRPNGFNVNRDYAGGAHSYGHDVVRDHYAFHGRDVHHFGHADMARWRGGHWNHNCFDGRCGWWWFAGGIWYYYDTPVYPYPLVVPDITYAEPMPVEPATPAAPVLIAKPPPKFRYYCDNPAGYYPQVTQCNGPYHQVAASP